MNATQNTTIGEPFECVERAAAQVLAEIGPYTAVVNDPPWSRLAPGAPPPKHLVAAANMDVKHLDTLVAPILGTGSEVVVGIGGGTALDTAKYVAWKCDLPLIQIPTITSVDAGFTEAIGVRIDGNVHYVGTVVPQQVVLDLELIGSAPKRLNRAGIGDILSCHTGLHDWRAAVDAGHSPDWNEALAALGAELLAELDDAIDDIADVNPAGIRFLADAYRRIGAACAAAGHSRFEEGSEHFWAYAYEHKTGAHHVHGELIAFATVAVAHVQRNGAEFASRLVTRSKAVAHPADLGIEREVFIKTLVGLRDYARGQNLDIGVADLHEITPQAAGDAWAFVSTLPRRNKKAVD
ncbi:iron-containing alcohol dehydrogenase [Ilumatobacter sp.]|uniref:iron-containing alcohol dehydrogenase n=1 Tax=Ilumatobacter sp. TaxID=1967498 RepID=UPI0037505FEF